MSFLVFTARKFMLRNQRNDINYKLMQKQQELMDLQAYTSAIGDGSVSLNDLTTSPTSMFGRMSQYMVGSHNYAMQAAGQDYAYLQGTMGIQQAQMPTAQMQYQQLVFKNLYDQRISQFQKSEEKRLQIKEKALDNEVLKLQNQLKLIEGELSALDSSIDKAAQEAAPRYA